MATTSHVSRRATAIFAIIFLLPALILFMMWSSIGLHASGLSSEEQISIYLDRFPKGLQSFRLIHIISVVCCVAAIILAVRSFRKHLLSVRVLMMLTVVVALFILLFDIYQMV